MLRGDGQAIVANGSSYITLSQALSVRVTDAGGLPVRNVAVKFVVSSNPSSLRGDLGGGAKSLNVITNDSGVAEATFRIRDKGVYTITVTAPGVSDTVIFTETGN
ncbi:MAG TPA: Ig-like domain-containing protein, partial [Gemmatimonadaceae bacterium]|nr:Ig-like domain-containing protein [Gemmatimonadaceae bacterium]